jgi:hypothetical protein
MTFDAIRFDARRLMHHGLCGSKPAMIAAQWQTWNKA